MPDFRVPRPADDASIDIVDVVHPYEKALANVESEEQAQAIVEAATPGQRLLWAYNRFFTEMEWNGIDFLFLNPTYGLVDEIIEAAEAFGLADEAQLLRDAKALFPEGGPSDDDDERQAQVDAIGEDAWQPLHERWRTIAESSSAEPIRRYILEHPDEFFRPEG